MTLDDKDRRIVVELEMKKSAENLAQARLAAEHGYWDLVANRLYYSVFHAVAAPLVFNRLKVMSHKGSVMLFNRHFLKEGIIPLEEGRIFSLLQTRREEADYNCWFEVDEEEMKTLIPRAESLIKTIQQLL